jgi:nucleotide-binding universal stress UspA family protein
MGKLGKRGVSRILLGSVAERVIEFANLPVLLVND